MSDSTAPKEKKEDAAPTHDDMVRQHIRLHPLSPDEFWVGIAKTKEELEATFMLLHDAYVGQGLMEPHFSGMRCNIYQALPYSSTGIVRHHDRIIGTLSLIKDSPLGFPSDKSFRPENDHYRRKNFRLGEFSALAIHKDYRSIGHKISLPLMKFMLLYATRYMDINMVIATVHPKSIDFYRALFGFHQNGKIVEYDFAKGAPAAHLTMNAQSVETWVEKTYRGLPAEKNLYQYVYETDHPALKFPKRTGDSAFDVVMTPDLLRYFFVERTNVFRNASPSELAMVRAAHEPICNTSQVPILCDAAGDRLFRFMTNISAAFITEKSVVVGSIYDLSESGAFFSTPHPTNNNEQGELVFNLDKQLFRIPASVVWENKMSPSHYPQGYGMRFLERRPDILRLLLNTSIDTGQEEKKAA